jgi:hypothetical protein
MRFPKYRNAERDRWLAQQLGQPPGGSRPECRPSGIPDFEARCLMQRQLHEQELLRREIERQGTRAHIDRMTRDLPGPSYFPGPGGGDPFAGLDQLAIDLQPVVDGLGECFTDLARLCGKLYRRFFNWLRRPQGGDV